MPAPLPATEPKSSRLHYWILGAVFVYELLLFTFFVGSAWGRRSPERPQTLTGEGVLIYSDGCGYYAWLRSALIDRDWNFENEFDEHNPLAQSLPNEMAPTGRRANHYPLGPALVWAPAIVVTHLICSQAPTPWPADGYSFPYQMAVGLTGLAVSGSTLILLFAICRLFVQRTTAALAVAFAVMGTTLLNYQAIELSMAHSSGAWATALLVWFWLKTYGSRSSLRWMTLGALVGLTALMRYQLALLAVLPAGEFVIAAFRGGVQGSMKALASDAGRLILAGMCAIAVFVPQMIAWKFIYGDYIVSPLVLAHSWLHPDFERILLSVDRGYFYWTPLTIGLLVGTIAAICRSARGELQPTTRRPRETLVLLLSAFALQVYLLASITGDGVFLGSSFGYRHLTEASVLLVPGLAFLLQSATPRRSAIDGAIGFLLCSWNVLLMAQYHRQILPRQGGADVGTLLQTTLQLEKTWPEGTCLFLTGPLLLGMSLLMRRHASGEVQSVEATLRPFVFLDKGRFVPRETPSPAEESPAETR